MLLIFPVAVFGQGLLLYDNTDAIIFKYGNIILSLLATSTTIVLVIYKSAITKKIFRKSKQKDPIWDEDVIKTLAKDLFFELMKGMCTKSVSGLEKRTTPEMYQDIINKAIQSTNLNIKAKFNYLDIKIAEIVGCEDYLDDTKDKVSVYLEGDIVFYRIHIPTNALIDESENGVREFNCLLSFIREENKWILYQQKYNINESDILFLKTKIQEAWQPT